MNRNFLYVMIGLVLGIVLGVFSYYSFPDKATASDIAKYMSLRQLGVPEADQDDHRAAGAVDAGRRHRPHGRRGDGRAGRREDDGWFVSASIVSLLLGLLMVDLLQARRRHRDRRPGDDRRQPHDAGVQHREFHRPSGADLDLQVAGRRRDPADRRVLGVRRRRRDGARRARQAAARTGGSASRT